MLYSNNNNNNETSGCDGIVLYIRMKSFSYSSANQQKQLRDVRLVLQHCFLARNDEIVRRAARLRRNGFVSPGPPSPQAGRANPSATSLSHRGVPK